MKNGSSPFKVAWYKSDTTESINYLKDDTIDVGITYTPAAEEIAIKQGVAKSPAWYAWRDHFLLVGPPSNPAGLKKADDIKTMFSHIYAVASAGDAANVAIPVRFLTRTNIGPLGDQVLHLSIDQALAHKTTIYKAATDDPADPLLNPAHMLVGKKASNMKMADKFTQWVISAEGQAVITGFKKNGKQLYTAAPANKILCLVS